MQAALALVLLLNGVQVNLPAPALRIEGKACVPLRAVCQRVGLTVQPEPGGRALSVTGPETRLRVRLSAPAGASTDLQGLRAMGTTYVPARALAEALGGTCAWDASTLTLDLRVSWKGQASAIILSQLRADSPAWRGRTVRVSGTVRRGWGSAGETSWAAPDGNLLEVGDAAGAARVSRALRQGAVLPPEQTGTKCLVRGAVGLLPTGEPWIGQAQVAAEGIPGDAALLETDRASARPGDRVALHLRLAGAPRPSTADLELTLLSALGADLSGGSADWAQRSAGTDWDGHWLVAAPPGRTSPLPYRVRVAGVEAPLSVIPPRAVEPADGGR